MRWRFWRKPVAFDPAVVDTVQCVRCGRSFELWRPADMTTEQLAGLHCSFACWEQDQSAATLAMYHRDDSRRV